MEVHAVTAVLNVATPKPQKMLSGNIIKARITFPYKSNREKQMSRILNNCNVWETGLVVYMNQNN